MSDLKKDLTKSGYDNEEVYFYRLNRKLAAQLKEKLGIVKDAKQPDEDEIGLEAIEYEEKKAA